MQMMTTTIDTTTTTDNNNKKNDHDHDHDHVNNMKNNIMNNNNKNNKNNKKKFNNNVSYSPLRLYILLLTICNLLIISMMMIQYFNRIEFVSTFIADQQQPQPQPQPQQQQQQQQRTRNVKNVINDSSSSLSSSLSSSSSPSSSLSSSSSSSPPHNNNNNNNKKNNNNDHHHNSSGSRNSKLIDQLLSAETIIETGKILLPYYNNNNNNNNTRSSTKTTTDNNTTTTSELLLLPTIAVCHRTMFGNQLDWDHIKEWFVYYRLLGVDKFFISYVPELINTTMIGQLQRLSYVDMILDTKTELGTQRTSNGEITTEPIRHRKNYGQEQNEQECINQRVGTSHDWVLTIDYDEFLWLSEKITLKEFVYQQHQLYNYTYLSFGKQMYDIYHHTTTSTTTTTTTTDSYNNNYYEETTTTTDSYNNNYYEGTATTTTTTTKEREEEDLNVFHFEKFPWTPGPYCGGNHRRRRVGDDHTYVCTGWPGRSKVMVKTPHIGDIKIHGNKNDVFYNPNYKHYPTNIAHLKEWGNYHLKPPPSSRTTTNTTTRKENNHNNNNTNNTNNTNNNNNNTSTSGGGGGGGGGIIVIDDNIIPLEQFDDDNLLLAVPRYTNFTAKTRNDTGIHDFETAHTYIDLKTKLINVYYDPGIQDWLQFLLQKNNILY